MFSNSRHPKNVYKLRKHHQDLNSVRNIERAPPAKADIATAMLTNVIEHLVWLFAPQKKTPSPPQRCGRISFPICYCVCVANLEYLAGGGYACRGWRSGSNRPFLSVPHIWGSMVSKVLADWDCVSMNASELALRSRGINIVDFLSELHSCFYDNSYDNPMFLIAMHACDRYQEASDGPMQARILASEWCPAGFASHLSA